MQIMQKLSTWQPSLESWQMVLQEIVAEKVIVVHIQEPSYEDPEHSNQRNKNQAAPQVVEIKEDVSDDSAQRYQDVEAATQAAFESAASAAATAKAAMELSRGQPRGPGDRRQTKHREETFDGKKSDKIGREMTVQRMRRTS
jgi:hypothetical protein